MKAETKESVANKVKSLRAEIAKDKADKVADGRKSGQVPASATTESQGETRAGGDKVVRVWDVPEEFEAVDFHRGGAGHARKAEGPGSQVVGGPRFNREGAGRGHGRDGAGGGKGLHAESPRPGKRPGSEQAEGRLRRPVRLGSGARG